MRQRDERSQRDPDSDERPRRPVRKSGMGMMVPLTIAAVIVCGVGLSMMGKSEKADAATQPVSDKPKPFADLPPEAPPQRTGGGGNGLTMVAKAPEGLANDPDWQKAVKLASEGETYFNEARDAKNAQDTAKANERGKLARDKLNEAIELTAAREDELLEKYGDANAEVRRIKSVRSGWIEKIIWLHKSVSR